MDDYGVLRGSTIQVLDEVLGRTHPEQPLPSVAALLKTAWEEADRTEKAELRKEVELKAEAARLEAAEAAEKTRQDQAAVAAAKAKQLEEAKALRAEAKAKQLEEQAKKQEEQRAEAERQRAEQRADAERRAEERRIQAESKSAEKKAEQEKKAEEAAVKAKTKADEKAAARAAKTMAAAEAAAEAVAAAALAAAAKEPSNAAEPSPRADGTSAVRRRPQDDSTSTDDAETAVALVETVQMVAKAEEVVKEANRTGATSAERISKERLGRAQSRMQLLKSRGASKTSGPPGEDDINSARDELTFAAVELPSAIKKKKDKEKDKERRSRVDANEAPAAPPIEDLAALLAARRTAPSVGSSWVQPWRSAGSDVGKAAEMEAACGFYADCLAACDDGDTLVCIGGDGDDKNVCVYSASASRATQTLTGHTHQICSVTVQGDLIASGARDCTIRLWSIAVGACTAVLQGSDDQIYGLSLDGDLRRPPQPE